ncbi:hypothetical protein ACLK1S_16900 [Escherichia coli]
MRRNIGKVATWLALPLSEFDQIITDDGLPESAVARWRSRISLCWLRKINNGLQ